MESSSLRFSQETQLCLMNKLTPKLKPIIHIRSFCAQTQNLKNQHSQVIVPPKSRRVLKASSSDAQLKQNWLTSLSYPPPLPQTKTHLFDEEEHTNEDNKWVLGIDPDVSGAVALLKMKPHDSAACIAQVFDSPFVQILVGKRTRKRLDANSIVQLVRSFDAPVGTTAYIEQSSPFPKDGKQGWWSGGFGYGLWIGILVASGFSVVPVPSVTWKAKFELSGSRTTKDDSRRVASTLFPSLSSMLSRKKDHGRAEALLIAAYGKNQNHNLESSCDTIIEKKLDTAKLA